MLGGPFSILLFVLGAASVMLAVGGGGGSGHRPSYGEVGAWSVQGYPLVEINKSIYD